MLVNRDKCAINVHKNRSVGLLDFINDSVCDMNFRTLVCVFDLMCVLKILCMLQELLINIDPLLTFGFKKHGAPFDTRQQAALRVGDMKVVTGPSMLGSWYKPLTVEGM